MRVLILGGTSFYGRTVADQALRSGHEVTLFSRGNRDDQAPPGSILLHGDRDGKLDALREGSWDAVLDSSGFVPRIVRQSAELLKGRVGLYAFVSSISVYPESVEPPITEESPIQTLEDPTVEVIDGKTYGGLKFLCEEVVREVFGEHALCIRPGLIVGPGDLSDRFAYWPWRMHRGGRVLIPERPDQKVQIIDVRDLAAWTLSLLERGIARTFHATGPNEPYRLGPLLKAICDRVNPEVELVSAPLDFLEKEGVAFWGEIPLCVGIGSDALMHADISNAMAAGLRLRSLEETIEDTLRFALQRGEDYAWKSGLTEERERQLLDKLGRGVTPSTASASRSEPTECS
jgi:2'-hydroxyisoflavone reductase